jgi:hypothetical protein
LCNGDVYEVDDMQWYEASKCGEGGVGEDVLLGKNEAGKNTRGEETESAAPIRGVDEFVCEYAGVIGCKISAAVEHWINSGGHIESRGSARDDTEEAEGNYTASNSDAVHCHKGWVV